MFGVLRAAVSGMMASKLRLDIIGNNLANINNPGFKNRRVELQDLPYEAMPNSQAGSGVELRLGAGSELMATQLMFLQGSVAPSSIPTDLAIYGDGFFTVQALDGSIAYTRNGNFRVDSVGQLVSPTGQKLVPPITLPADFRDLAVREDGAVEVKLAGQDVPTVVGQVQLARFVNPAGLIATGDGLLRATDASGPAETGSPGSIGFGRVQAGAIEESTVDLAEEMTQMLLAQRAYELNSRAFQTLDQMVGKLTEFRR
ncbi:MAG: flagellar basal-body rod protein FlgG [Chloroflexi bacterium]|nr:flagellar basal-body rod protein FlgG [Chloroflexota bacterium]